MAKKQAKKRHIANSDTDSENSYAASQPTKSSSSTSTKTPYVPRFLLIHSEQEETISSLSPFLVHKTIMSLTGEPKSIKTLRSGDLLIQCAKESHEKTLLQMKTFCNLKCSVKPHSSLNTSKGIVRCPALSKVTTEHIIEFMGEQGVTDVRRITVRRDGILKPTNTFVLTFNTQILPTVVKIGFIQVKVDVYIPNPFRCYNCQVFGHHENKCGRQHPVCCNCAQPEHCASGQCDKPAKRVNCSGDHPANSKECPQWEKEKQILKIKCEQNISYQEARKQYEQFNGAKTYASAVKPGTCNKSTQTENNSTQTDDSFTKYLQQQATQKTKDGSQGKSNSSPHPGKSNSSPGPALKAGTLEMIKKDEEKKRKEAKDKLKKQQKEERKQIFLKEKAQKDKEAEKTAKSQKNPYSVFSKNDEEDEMEDDSVVFTEPSSSDHLPKGTLSRLPLT